MMTLRSEGRNPVEKPWPARPAGRADAERGAALVEFALVLPLIMSLVLGLVTAGGAYNRKLSLTDGVREGSRFGATLNGPTTNGWLSDVQNRTAELSTGEVTTNQICVKLVKAGTGDVYAATPSGCSSVAEPATPSTTATGDCVVKIWASRPVTLQAMFFSANVTLTGKSVSRYEGKVTGATTCN
jgi:Flp pilus assembly protein TadG